MKSELRLLGKNAVVTGGSSGIGLAIAQAFVEEGAKVAITGRDADVLNEAVKVIGSDSISVPADVKSVSQIALMFKTVSEQLGGLDILVANAGIAVARSLDDASEELFDEIVQTNLRGTYFTVQKSLPYLNQGASIILISSALGQLGIPGLSIYGATKAAIRSLARSFSAELINRDIRVNTLSPGPVDTPIFGKMGMQPEDLATHIEIDIPLKRMGRPEEIGHTAVYLASDESAYMAGSELIIDGGHSQI
mgnify:FL=1